MGLATSGSGDTLAGIVAGLAARGASAVQAAAWAVFLHGKAGRVLSRRMGSIGFLAQQRGAYGFMQGTSMAAPQVTGAAAAVASKTGLRGSALRARLLSTADDKGAAGYDTKFGNGRLNVYRAVTGASLPAGQ